MTVAATMQLSVVRAKLIKNKVAVNIELTAGMPTT